MGNIWRLDWVTLVGLTNLIKKHYPFLIVCGLLLHRVNSKNVGLVVLVFILCQFILNVAQQCKAYQHFWLMYFDLFSKRKPSFRQYRISDYFDIEKINNFFKIYGMNPYLEIFHKDLDEAVCIIDSRSLGPEIITDLVCVARPMFRSYIFIKQAPNSQMLCTERFKIAHEIGHFALSPLYLTSKRTGGLLMAIIFVLLLYMFVDFTLIPNWLKIAYGCIFLFKLVNWIFLWLPSNHKDEVYADLFALYLLSDDEKKAIEQRFSMPRYKPELFFINSRVTKSFSRRRTEMFLRNLKVAIDKSTLQYVEATIQEMETPIIIKFVINILLCLFYLSFGLFLKQDLSFNLSLWLLSDIVALVSMIVLQYLNVRADDYLIPNLTKNRN